VTKQLLRPSALARAQVLTAWCSLVLSGCGVVLESRCESAATEGQCSSRVSCRPQFGERYDPDGECFEPEGFAFCESATPWCGGDYTEALLQSPEGGCWLVSAETCNGFPEGWVVPTGAPCPQELAFGRLTGDIPLCGG